MPPGVSESTLSAPGSCHSHSVMLICFANFHGPSYVNTPLVANAIKSGIMGQEFERTPVGRPADAEEVADSIAFLASPMSSFIYGAGLTVDGGYSL